MTLSQISVFALLAVTILMFIWNRWRYDVIAGLALLVAVYLGLVDANHAFDGFSHPAVITVACVLVISRALQNSGVVELLLRVLEGSRKTTMAQIAANCGMVGLLSAFMNNVGALALMLPVSIRDAAKANRPASRVLMPLSFASMLGGLVTLIGTPPNIIIATFREEATGQPFGMFDFTPVGLVVAFFGLLFIITIGWRLIPEKPGDKQKQERFQITRYMTEAKILEGSNLVNSTVGDLEKICESEISVIAIIRRNRNRLAPSTAETLLEDDVLILQGHSETLNALLENPGLLQIGVDEISQDILQGGDVRIIEAVVMPNSRMEGALMRGLRLHERYGVNLLGVSREGNSPMLRLGRVRVKIGDVLLLQGHGETVEQTISTLGCMTISSKGATTTVHKHGLLTPLVFVAGIVSAATGFVPVQIAFATTCVALIMLNAIKLGDAYKSIEWPVIVLLGCLIPIGEALQSTGGTELISSGILGIADDIPVWMLITVLLVVSMLLSDLIHNSPTAVLMAPLTISLAEGMQISPDPLLMAVAVGAASAFLTPIGHQSNTLVMGPGGYRFGDYWKMGLPLDFVIIVVAVPMIMWVWY
jgi:di/tricarboxylate transporter